MQTVQTQIRLIRIYAVCHSTKYLKKQLHEKQNLDKKVWIKVFKILGRLPYLMPIFFWLLKYFFFLYKHIPMAPDKALFGHFFFFENLLKDTFWIA